MKVNRKFEGIWIPAMVWESKELSTMEKLFLVEINSLDNDEGCFASNGYFSGFFQLSKNRCTEIIKSLEKKEFISVELHREGKRIVKRVLRVLPIRKTEYYLFGKPNNPIRKTEQPYSENREDNNTITNNTKERVTRAWDFLKNENIIRWESWVMHHKKQIKDFKNFVSTFNDKVDIEDLDWTLKILYARLDMLFRNWQRIENDGKVRKLKEAKEDGINLPSRQRIVV